MVDIVVDLNNLMGELLKAGGTDLLDRMNANGDRIVFTQALLDEFEMGGGDRFFDFPNLIGEIAVIAGGGSPVNTELPYVMCRYSLT